MNDQSRYKADIYHSERVDGWMNSSRFVVSRVGLVLRRSSLFYKLHLTQTGPRGVPRLAVQTEC